MPWSATTSTAPPTPPSWRNPLHRRRIRSVREQFLPFPQFLQDLFTAFFRDYIILREYHEVESPFRFNLALLGDFTVSKPFLRMHELTVLNEAPVHAGGHDHRRRDHEPAHEPEIKEKEGMARAEEMLRETELNIELIEDLYQQAGGPRGAGTPGKPQAEPGGRGGEAARGDRDAGRTGHQQSGCPGRRRGRRGGPTGSAPVRP